MLIRNTTTAPVSLPNGVHIEGRSTVYLPTSIWTTQKADAGITALVAGGQLVEIPNTPTQAFLGDQDPIFDHTLGTRNSVTAAMNVIVPPTGCKFVRISSTADIVYRTDGIAASDAAGSTFLPANTPEVIPVIGGVAVSALSLSGTAIVRCTPLKVR